MRNKPARQLCEGDLIVDSPYAATQCVTGVSYPVPENIVEVELLNQLTDETTTRTLRWDDRLMVDQPLAVPIGASGLVTVELALLCDDDERPRYRYYITDEAEGVADENTDLVLTAGGRPDAVKAMKILLDTLIDAAGTSSVYIDPDEQWSVSEQEQFSPNCVDWAGFHIGELTVKRRDLGMSLGTPGLG